MKSETAKAAAAEIYRQIGLLGPLCNLVTDKQLISNDNIYTCLRTPAESEFGLERPLQGNIVIIRDPLVFARRAERAVQQWLDKGLESMLKLIDEFLQVHGAVKLSPSLSQDELADMFERFIPDSFDLGCFESLRLKLTVQLGQVYHSHTDEEWELYEYLPLSALEEICRVAEAAETAQDPANSTWRQRPSLF